jgi:hypothetical protein
LFHVDLEAPGFFLGLSDGCTTSSGIHVYTVIQTPRKYIWDGIRPCQMAPEA